MRNILIFLKKKLIFQLLLKNLPFPVSSRVQCALESTKEDKRNVINHFVRKINKSKLPSPNSLHIQIPRKSSLKIKKLIKNQLTSYRNPKPKSRRDLRVQRNPENR
jgi:hypothetical protein